MKIVKTYYALTMIITMWSGTLLHAETWFVEKDGSGDYTTIQPALDGAAVGDTIMLGHGRFAECSQYTTPGWTEDVYAVIRVDSLTLIGSGNEATILGPEHPVHLPSESPKGVVSVFLTQLTVVGVAVENTREGLYCSDGHLEIVNCLFRGCTYGVGLFNDRGVIISNCSFIDNSYGGVIAFSPARDIDISDSIFVNGINHVSFNGASNSNIVGCEFIGSVVATKHHDLSSGSIVNCRYEDIANFAIDVAAGSTVVIEGNVVTGGASHLYIGTSSHVQGTGNRFCGGTYSTIVNAHSTMDFHGNHILNSGGYTIKLEVFHEEPPVIIDLSSNYWGTAESDSIDAWIYDGNDSEYIKAFVDYEPFSVTPLATERKSVGGIKVLYR